MQRAALYLSTRQRYVCDPKTTHSAKIRAFTVTQRRQHLHDGHDTAVRGTQPPESLVAKVSNGNGLSAQGGTYHVLCPVIDTIPMSRCVQTVHMKLTT